MNPDRVWLTSTIATSASTMPAMIRTVFDPFTIDDSFHSVARATDPTAYPAVDL
jgi:hypothetical protein